MHSTGTEVWGLPIATFNILLGALIALVPVGLNFLYDSFQRRKERRTTVKREVLLKAAEGAALLGELIGNYQSGDVKWEDMVRAAPGWMLKVHLVASDKTIKAFMDVADMFASAMMQLEPLTARSRTLTSAIDALKMARENLLTQLGQLNTNPGATKRVVDVSARKDKLIAAIDMNTRAQNETTDARSKLYQEVAHKCLALHYEHDELVMKAIAAARRDLGLGGGSKEYQRMVNESTTRLRELFARSMQEVDSRFTDVDQHGQTSASATRPAQKDRSPE